MPCGYHLNQEDGLVTITGSGEVSLSEAISIGRELLDDPVFDPQLPHLIDLRGVEVEHSHDDSMEFREFVLQAYRPGVDASIAVVIDHSLDQAAVANLFHLSCAMEQTELFDQYDQALKWLMRREFVQTAVPR